MELLNVPALSVRLATAKDIPAIRKLVNAAYRGESGRRGWTTESDLLSGQRVDDEQLHDLFAATNSHVLLAIDEEHSIVGCVHVKKQSSSTTYLGMLTTDVHAQALGIGSRLLGEAESYARNVFRSAVIEMTVIDLRKDLIAWYTKRGYRETGECRAFPYGNERFGIPLRDDLKFTVLQTQLVGPSQTSQ